MKTYNLVLATALTISGSAWVTFDPADAQGISGARQQRDQENRRRNRNQPPAGQVQAAAGQQLSAEESTAIRPVLEAVRAENWAAAAAAHPAAVAAAQSPYARYVVGQLQYEIGRGTQNVQLQSQATDAMLASGAAPVENLQPLLNNQTAFALRAENYALAETSLARLIELEPSNTERLTQLAEVKIHLNKRPEALTLYRRIAEVHRAAGQPVPDSVTQRVLALSADAGQTGEALALSLTLLETSPTPENWRNAIYLYRQTARPQEALALDLRRFMRAAGIITDAGDYVLLADAASRAGMLGEAKAALDEGISRNVVPASDRDARELLASVNPRVSDDRASLAGFRTRALAASNGRQARTTADAFYGYGQYAEAAELYRTALQKGGEDANLVNLRLGASLALSRNKAEAETAFRAVTGPRADIARFWLLWLRHQP